MIFAIAYDCLYDYLMTSGGTLYLAAMLLTQDLTSIPNLKIMEKWKNIGNMKLEESPYTFLLIYTRKNLCKHNILL